MDTNYKAATLGSKEVREFLNNLGIKETGLRKVVITMEIDNIITVELSKVLMIGEVNTGIKYTRNKKFKVK